MPQYSNDDKLFNVILQAFDEYLEEYKKLTQSASTLFRNASWQDQREHNRRRNRILNDSILECTKALNQIHNENSDWEDLISSVDDFEHHYSSNVFKSYFNTIQRVNAGNFAIREIHCATYDKLDQSEIDLIALNADHNNPEGIIIDKIHLSLKEDEKVYFSGFLKKFFDGLSDYEQLLFWPHLFYRNQHAYFLGYKVSGSKFLPIAIPFVNTDGQIKPDTILFGEEDIIKIVEFTRSYLFVESSSPENLIAFLKQMLPSKETAQLIINLGWQEWGKSLQKQKIALFIEENNPQFDHAPGVRGMVMNVFTVENLPFVFKTVKQKIAIQKDTNRLQVLDRYRFVSEHDRVGRLADAQLFDYWEMPVKNFSQELLNELLSEENKFVFKRKDKLIFREIFSERKMTPLNLYLEDASENSAFEAVNDYGLAIKELAMSNLFPGDLLLKNFGVTPEKKLVFYDYDETTYLTECNFRKFPQARNELEIMDSDTHIVAGKNDIFPEEFEKFLIPAGKLRDHFKKNHGEIFTAEFWNEWKNFHLQGKIIDLQPY